VREIIFFKNNKGNSPIKEFLDSLSAKQAKKVSWVLNIIEEFQIVPIQYFKKLEGTSDIWEVRIDSGSDTFRLLGFFDKGNLIILTNGFAKKSQKTPSSEISLAEARKEEYLR
jgi:phage-related protein